MNYNPQIFPAKRCDSTIKKSQSNKPFYSLFLMAQKNVGWPQIRGGRDHLFSLKFCIFFIEFSEK